LQRTRNEPIALVDNAEVSIPGDEITPGVVDLGKTGSECDHGSDIGPSGGDHDSTNSQNACHSRVL
jgi:hypothetical protein